ncbi:hypothetical protein, partial [Paenibacillus cisolokensis]|uniref:hypothetical protein n=1 Tax=Paenibacillus cisolokensis TaxID=1658519 RepID=UPI001BCEA948
VSQQPEKCRIFGPNRRLWCKILRKYSNFLQFLLIRFNRNKIPVQSQEFLHFGYFIPGKIALLQLLAWKTEALA